RRRDTSPRSSSSCQPGDVAATSTARSTIWRPASSTFGRSCSMIASMRVCRDALADDGEGCARALSKLRSGVNFLPSVTLGPRRPRETCSWARSPAWLDETQAPEPLIIAGGGVVVDDVRLQVHAHGPASDDVDATALPQAGAARAPRSTAVCTVVDDRAVN